MTETQGSMTRASAFDRAAGLDDLTIVGLVAFLARHRRLLLSAGLAMALVVGIVAFVRPRTYTSTARFMPQASSEGALSRLSGLAATLGVSVPGADPGSSPNFYADLLKSRDVLRTTVETRYAFLAQGDSMRGTLIDLLEAHGTSAAARRDDAARQLLENSTVTIGRETGTVALEVTMPWAELSQQVATRMIQLVSDFNLHRRQTQAGAERRFVESRLAEARDSLRSAEARLEGFLQRNREYRTSPQLLFAYDRLERDVTMQQQVFTTLAQSYEGARIDEVRNTPVITIVEAPDLPAKPDARLALVKSLLAGMLGLALGALYAAARQAFVGVYPARIRRRAGDSAPSSPDAGSRPLVATARPDET